VYCSTKSRPEAWIIATTARLWPGDNAPSLELLKGDASNRRFWRVRIAGESRSPRAPDSPVNDKSSLRLFGAPASAIAVDLGPDDLPLYARALGLLAEPLSEPPWLNVHRLLTKIAVAVPVIFAADTTARMLLVEDVGDVPLFEAARRGKAGDLYRLAVDQLMLFHASGIRQLADDCIAAKLAYDQRLFRWELQQFVEVGGGLAGSAVDRGLLESELDQLAARLDRFPRVLSHRDYHGHNLFVQRDASGCPRLRVIDFQDALMAPAAQDLAVLLTTRDAAQVITPTTERRLLDYYYAALIRRGVERLPFEEFLESYRLCVLQHALKVIGRFTVLEREGKSGYQHYIPFALAQARRILSLSDGFAGLRAMLGAE
jgi:N-acetylmuramate 1-kinase